MSSKSANKSKTTKAKLDRPFSPAIQRQAQEIAAGYRIVIQPDDEVGYLGRVMEMPLVMADGASPQVCYDQVREAAVGAIATMLELGQIPPAAADQKRTLQINVRVTEDERMRLEDAARKHGFRGVSDFVRTTALAKSG